MSNVVALNQTGKEDRTVAVKNSLEVQRIAADRKDDVRCLDTAIQQGLLGENSQQIAYMNASISPGIFGNVAGSGGSCGGSGGGGGCVCIC